MTRRLACTALILAVASAVLVAPSPALATVGERRTTAITVSGDVAIPTSYTVAALTALPQTTLSLLRAGTAATATGVSLQSIVQAAAPNVPAGTKNPTLRVSVTVIAAHDRAISFALGEQDGGFGNRPALLRTSATGRVDLVVPGDSTAVRSLTGVTNIVVGVPAGSAFIPRPGGIVVVGKHRTVTLSAKLLVALPASTISVSYLAGTTPQQHTERGPQLWLVLLAAGIIPNQRTTVAAVASDGYTAVVTPLEILTGGRRLIVSLAEDGATLAQPRLIVSGDIKGGRYVSDVTGLVVAS